MGHQFSIPLRYLFAAHPQAMGKALRIIYRAISTHLLHKARLAALVPKPRVNLTRYHGVLAPNHRWRGEVTPAKRGKGAKRIANTDVHSPAERRVTMFWDQRLKRVFNIDIDVLFAVVDR